MNRWRDFGNPVQDFQRAPLRQAQAEAIGHGAHVSKVAVDRHLRRYNSFMSSTLASANPYLRDPAQRRRSVLKSVATSSAIEGIRAPFKKATDKRKAGSTAVTRAKP